MHGTVTRLGEFTRSIPGICHIFRRLGPLTAALDRKSWEEERNGVTRADDDVPTLILGVLRLSYLYSACLSTNHDRRFRKCIRIVSAEEGQNGMNFGMIRAFARTDHSHSFHQCQGHDHGCRQVEGVVIALSVCSVHRVIRG